MDECTYRYLCQGEAVAYLGCSLFTAHDSLTYLKTVGGDHVSLGAVCVVKERDTSRTVRIILDALNCCGYTVVCSLEINETQFSLVATPR